MPMAMEFCPCSRASRRFKWDGKQLKRASWMFAKTLHHQLGPGPIITKYPDNSCFPKSRHKAQLLTYPFRQILSIRVVGRRGSYCTLMHVWLWNHTWNFHFCFPNISLQRSSGHLELVEYRQCRAFPRGPESFRSMILTNPTYCCSTIGV